MNCNFTYEHFKECILKAKKLGFSILPMHEFHRTKPKGKTIIMRHDVDLSPVNALKMAEIENSIDIKSTYFIRVEGLFNPYYDKNKEIIREISKLGHEIGLHYEYSEEDRKSLKPYLIHQKKLFEIIIKKQIYGVALHNVKNLNKAKTLKLNIVESFLSDIGLKYDAYSDLFMKDMKYISDSKYRWKEGCICTHIKKEKRLCILTHPVWWSSTTTSLVSIMENIFSNK